MIRLEKVNKYFNRFKTNQIHAIDNTSLEFPDTGLVALLGPSGCGKTTLLNAIGGLDKVNSGKIYINGKKMPKTFSYKKDKIRTLNIGYIFQNYNLLDNLSVYDNVAISLRMIGIKNKKEIKKRVDYVLEKVDMYRFRNRLCSNLSGGQRQRVGIARAIVKNPSVIIADEPTGNLDSKNTLEIMNIIKSISQKKLVILVTHEKELANFYASRIVNISDGKVISDKENNHENELDYRIDNNIYLKDFTNHNKIKDKSYDIDIYSDDNTNLDLDIVLKNGNIYIKTKNDKIEIVDEDSSVKFINDHYKKISKKDYEKSGFDLNVLDNSNHRLRYTSVRNIFASIIIGFKRVLDYSLIKKILLLGFFISAMFILFAVSNIFGVTNIKDSDFIKYNRNYAFVNSKKGDFDTYNKLKEQTEYVIPGDSNSFFFVTRNDLYQFSARDLVFEASIADTSLVSNLIYGKMPSNSKEVVIDKMIYDKTKMVELSFSLYGALSYEDMVGLKITKGNLNYTIVGVCDSASPSLYVSKEEFNNIVSIKEDKEIKYLDYHLAENINLKEGHNPDNDYEIMVNINNKENMPLNKESNIKINDHKLKVVGYYTTPYDDDFYYVSSNMVNIINIANNKGFTIYSKDKDVNIDKLETLGIHAVDTYKQAKEEYLKDMKSSLKSTFIISGILLAISFIEIYLMIRASFMSRIKETGIMRAIGVKKRDIYKMFSGEILVITTMASVPGIIVMAALLKEISKIQILDNLFLVTPGVVILSIILVYGFNLLVGLLPIWNIIRKTPAEILSRNDVD